MLLAPWWVVVVGLLCWLGLLVLCLRWWTPHPDRLPWLGGSAFLLWAALMIGGGIVLGWHGLWTVRR